jgi:hypothetical protein
MPKCAVDSFTLPPCLLLLFLLLPLGAKSIRETLVSLQFLNLR